MTQFDSSTPMEPRSVAKGAEVSHSGTALHPRSDKRSRRRSRTWRRRCRWRMRCGHTGRKTPAGTTAWKEGRISVRSCPASPPSSSSPSQTLCARKKAGVFRFRGLWSSVRISAPKADTLRQHPPKAPSQQAAPTASEARLSHCAADACARTPTSRSDDAAPALEWVDSEDSDAERHDGVGRWR